MVDKHGDIAISQEYIEFEQKHNRHLNMMSKNVVKCPLIYLGPKLKKTSAV